MYDLIERKPSLCEAEGGAREIKTPPLRIGYALKSIRLRP